MHGLIYYTKEVYMHMISYESISVFSDNERRMALSTSGNFSAADCLLKQEWSSY
jgi:hypothetical protein